MNQYEWVELCEGVEIAVMRKVTGAMALEFRREAMRLGDVRAELEQVTGEDADNLDPEFIMDVQVKTERLSLAMSCAAVEDVRGDLSRLHPRLPAKPEWPDTLEARLAIVRKFPSDLQAKLLTETNRVLGLTRQEEEDLGNSSEG